ncbi:crossover junction endonuclease MUS81 [Macrosteles quadrilineatus]|uniref:crossover junction endonuclease MUS81 n=1 Tax=Macrosteles quadrilineatus TaxID=74068 RepID=UPI0023E0FBD2|nr:crossover junction endonuclease MUS81 [Macrosteles quadrilineatus]
MSSDNVSLKRKTVKLKHPNPLFEKWIEEWKNEAASRNSDTQYAFAKALQSLRKYPLPLKTGKECLILENFGTRICLLLDRKLSDYQKTHPEGEDAEDEIIQEVADETKSPKPKRAKKVQKKPTSPKKKRGKSYVPTLRSAPYAVLLALFEHLQKNGPPGEMFKSELQKAAQPLCDTSMFKPLPGSYYSGWSCVGKLVTQQLVSRAGNPHRFSLTEEGIKLAEKLSTEDFYTPLGSDLSLDKLTSVSSSLPVEVGLSSSPCKQLTDSRFSPRKEIPAALSSKESTKNQNKFGRKKNPKQNSQEPLKNFQVPEAVVIEDDVVSDFPFLTQESSSSQGSQVDEIIFLPGSFETILLVDTQEIHKGDELVKALEAEGVKLEVRKLMVGDFAWVGRNAAGTELLLPFIVERKRLDDLASSIKDGRFHEQKFRMKQSGVPHCMYLVESHGQRQYSLPTTTLLQAAANTEFVDKFSVKYTSNSHETVVYLATFTKVLTRKFAEKMLIGCAKNNLPEFNIQDDCVSLMRFKEFNKLSSKTRKYNVKEMFIKQLVQLRGLSVEKALAIVERYPSPRSLISAYEEGGGDKLLADISAGTLNRKIGPVISKAVFELYSKSVLS